ncbi:MAG TPA: hypothetical protein PKN13_07835 [Accumulibacter sp.]|nr:hypothetical protein [Accumulibacter sp.]HMW17710.1 hypothetical protein [Accumulibacter sp.]HMX22306.1 hypothetical protein [Accumulibacter sp.]HND80453.1 hypothetical protein [Accumulibacter sp.]HNE12972.1 hypothetical protein [Accumulibacter sp.]
MFKQIAKRCVSRPGTTACAERGNWRMNAARLPEIISIIAAWRDNVTKI